MILLQEAAKEEQDTDDLEEEDEEAQRRASCVETRALCIFVCSSSFKKSLLFVVFSLLPRINFS